MSCADIEDKLELFLLGELDPRQERAVGTHLTDCPACRGTLEEAKDLLGRLDRALAPQVSAEAATRRILARIGPRPNRILHWTLVGLGAAAAVWILLVVGNWLVRPQERPQAARAVVNATSKQAGGRTPSRGIDLAHCEIQRVSDAEYEVLAPRLLRLDRGQVSLRVEPAEAMLVVRTPAAKVTALGTEFSVDVGRRERRERRGGGPARPVTTVAVQVGTVRVQNDHGVETATAGESIVAWSDAAPKKRIKDRGVE